MKCVYKMTKQELLDEVLRLRMLISKLSVLDEDDLPDFVKLELVINPYSKHSILLGYVQGVLNNEVKNFKENKN